MPTAPAIIETVGDNRDGSQKLIRWALTSAVTTGDPVSMSEWRSRSVHVNSATFTAASPRDPNNPTAGTWATGTGFGAATCVIEGANSHNSGDPLSWVILEDENGTALSFTAEGLEQVNQEVAYIRPRLSVAGVGAQVGVALLGSMPTPGLNR